MGLTGPRAEPQLEGLAKHLAKKNQPCTDEISMLMECMAVRHRREPSPSVRAAVASNCGSTDRMPPPRAQKHEALLADSSCARQRAALAFCMAQSKGKQDPLARIGQQVKRLSRYMRRFGW
jgi:hypothetical protein